MVFLSSCSLKVREMRAVQDHNWNMAKYDPGHSWLKKHFVQVVTA